MQVIRTLLELDEKLQDVGRAALVGDDAMRRVFSSFQMNLDTDLPADPFSDEYRKFQMSLYETVSGRNYDVRNEVSAFDVSAHVTRPFPFVTESVATTGAHLSSLGFFVSQLRVPRGGRILEFGPGWGNTTITLAMLGFEMTAIDVEPNFCELLRRRAEVNQVSVNVILGDFFKVEEIAERYDAVVFYECFHHCADHLRLLRGLHNVLKPGGRVYLGSEPINPYFSMPWGLRLDGESLWAVRQNGWMELGFTDEYFTEAVGRTGWSPKRYASKDVDWAVVWELERLSDHSLYYDASNTILQTLIGHRSGDAIVVDGAQAGFALYGPYIKLDAGKWRGTVYLKPGSLRFGHATIDVGDFSRNEAFGSLSVDLDGLSQRGENSISISFFLSEPKSNVEIRLDCALGTKMTIVGLGLVQGA